MAEKLSFQETVRLSMDLYAELMDVMRGLSESASIEEIWGETKAAVNHEQLMRAENVVNRLAILQQTSTDSYVPIRTWAERAERKAKENHPAYQSGWHYIDGIFEETTC